LYPFAYDTAYANRVANSIAHSYALTRAMTSSRPSILDRANFGPPPAIELGGRRPSGDALTIPVASPSLEKQPAPELRAGLRPKPRRISTTTAVSLTFYPEPEPKSEPQAAPALNRTQPRFSLKKRLAVLAAAFAVPAMAAPGDFGAMAADAPGQDSDAKANVAAASMPFEEAGMSFPGSAFYYLADPPSEALVALPTSDPLERGAEGGREIGQMIDAGPSARPFMTPVDGTGYARARDCLAQAVWYEAASESDGGQRAVAQVVLNRVAHPSWPGSVCGVVYQGSARSTGCQFSFTCDGSLARRASGSGWAQAQRVASEALSGKVYAPIGHATHYHTLWVNPYWAVTLDHVGTIGAHRFYRNRGKAGEKSAFTTRYTGREPSVNDRASRAGRTSVEAVETANLSIRSAAQSTHPQAAPNSVPAPAASRTRSAALVDDTVRKIEQAEFLADPELQSAGQARQEYSRAGKWKTDPSTLDISVEPAPTASAPSPVGQ